MRLLARGVRRLREAHDVEQRGGRLPRSAAAESGRGARRRLAPWCSGRGREREAAALLERVVEREPDNLTAWGLLLAFARERDPAAARRALAARRRLDPLRAPGRRLDLREHDAARPRAPPRAA